MPFITFNLAISLTQITLRDFILGNLGMLPGLALRVFIGTTLSSLTQDGSGLKNNKLLMAFVIVGTLLAILGMIYISIKTKRHLQELNLNNDKEDDDDSKEALKLKQETELVNPPHVNNGPKQLTV